MNYIGVALLLYRYAQIALKTEVGRETIMQFPMVQWTHVQAYKYTFNHIVLCDVHRHTFTHVYKVLMYVIVYCVRLCIYI